MDAPAGWYPDPLRPGRVRYWDGRVWSDHTTAVPDAAEHVHHPGAPAVDKGPWRTRGWFPIVVTGLVLALLVSGVVAGNQVTHRRCVTRQHRAAARLVTFLEALPETHAVPPGFQESERRPGTVAGEGQIFREFTVTGDDVEFLAYYQHYLTGRGWDWRTSFGRDGDQFAKTIDGREVYYWVDPPGPGTDTHIEVGSHIEC